MITFGSLFSGIGGFEIGFERAGMEVRWQVEIDEYANKVLAKHWPNVHRERDIRTVGRRNLERVDVICGGFPCQDISYAGLGAGLDGERSGLFFEAIRVVQELRPRVVVLENVAALLTRGLDRVLGTLAEIGYDAEWHCIPAAAVGAPHIRDRVFVLANSISDGWGSRRTEREGLKRGVASIGTGALLADTKHDWVQERWRVSDVVATSRRSGIRRDDGQGGEQQEAKILADSKIQRLERQRIVTGGTLTQFRNACYESWWKPEPELGRVANGIPSRVDRLRGIGNAVVPQVAEWIGRQVVSMLAIVDKPPEIG